MAPKPKKMVQVYTWNVKMGLLTGIFYSLGYGLFQQTILPSFILFVGGSNLAIGFAEGLQGISNLLTAIPSGWLADTYSRSTIIRIGSLLWMLACVCLLAAVVKAEPDSQEAFTLLCVALALEGICDGIIFGPLVALMDDSVPAGYRSDVETFNSVACTVANAVGPMISALIFTHSGNTWSIHTMKVIIVTGALIGQGSNVFGMLMDDKKSLGMESEAVHMQEGLLDNAAGAQGGKEEEGGEKEEEDKTTAPGKATFFGLASPSTVIYWLFIADLITGLGAGMTVKFFPVFFQKEGQVSPATINVVFAALGGFTAVGTLIVQKLAKRFGRLEVIIPCFTIGVVCTMLMGALRDFYTNAYVMIPLFILRCTMMWSTGPLQGSIVADYTPKSTRARWKALNSVTAAGWSGSAAVGGWLIDQYGYGPCFVITAIFQAISIPFLIILLPHVAKETDLADAMDRRHAGEGGRLGTPSGHTPILTPLLRQLSAGKQE